MIITQTPFRISFLGGGTDYPSYCETHGSAVRGLGSSSSFVVGLLNALAAFQNRSVRPLELARQAIEIEQDILSEAFRDRTAGRRGAGADAAESRLRRQPPPPWRTLQGAGRL